MPQTTDGRPDREPSELSPTEFMDRWSEAIVSNDVARIAPFTTDDWVLIDQPGTITRERFHSVVADGRLRHDAMTHEVLGVDRYGPVAVVRTLGRTTSWFQGRRSAVEEWTTNLLVEGPEGWHCVLTQLTPRLAAQGENPGA